MNPFDEPYWNIIQLFAWVHTGNRSLVRRASEWIDKDEIFTEELEFPDGRRKIVNTKERITDIWPIFVASAFKGLSKNTYEETKTAIWAALQNGTLTGSGLPNKAGPRREIQSLEWIDLDLANNPVRVVPKNPTRVGLTERYKVRFSRDEVFLLWPDPLAVSDDAGPSETEHGIELDRDGQSAVRSGPNEKSKHKDSTIAGWKAVFEAIEKAKAIYNTKIVKRAAKFAARGANRSPDALERGYRHYRNYLHKIGHAATKRET